MNVPEPLPVYTAAYQDFKGVDFTSAICDRQHFPIAKNFVIKDTVEKRCGYDKIASFDGRINGIYKFKLKEEAYTVVHAGSALYKTDDKFNIEKVLAENINDDKSQGISTINGDFIILTGKEIINMSICDYGSNVDFIEYTASGEFKTDTVNLSVDTTIVEILSVAEIQVKDYSINETEVVIDINSDTQHIFENPLHIETRTKSGKKCDIEIQIPSKTQRYEFNKIPDINNRKNEKWVQGEAGVEVEGLEYGVDYNVYYEDNIVYVEFNFTSAFLGLTGKTIEAKAFYSFEDGLDSNKIKQEYVSKNINIRTRIYITLSPCETYLLKDYVRNIDYDGDLYFNNTQKVKENIGKTFWVNARRASGESYCSEIQKFGDNQGTFYTVNPWYSFDVESTTTIPMLYHEAYLTYIDEDNKKQMYDYYYDDLPICNNQKAEGCLLKFGNVTYDQPHYYKIPIQYENKVLYLPYSITETTDTDKPYRKYFNLFMITSNVNLTNSYLNSITVPERGTDIEYTNDEDMDVSKIPELSGGFSVTTPYFSVRGDSLRILTSDDPNGQIIYVLGTEEDPVLSVYIECNNIIESLNVRSKKYDDGRKLYYVTTNNASYVLRRLKDKPFRLYIKTRSSEKIFQENKLWQCTIQASMQYGNGLYYFYSGNKDFPNRDWHSEINEPLNVSSVNYTIYGVNDEVAGYGQYGQYLAVFKKGGNDKNIYLRQAQYIDSLGVTFPVSVGVGGAMPVLSPHTVENLAGETLYLTSDGIYALTTLSTTDFQVTKKRSYFVDGKLKKEINPENAIACTWRGMYLLAINGNVYVLDGTQQKNFIEGTSNEYSYECLFWDNIPARMFFHQDDDLYFGCEDGSIMKFSDKYSDNGQPIEMVIATKLDDDGDFMSLKKMQKKGTGILVMPHPQSSFDISFRYDSNVETFVKKAYADIFDFGDIDFERFTFETSENPRIIPFLKKSKKYRALQIILRSVNNEPLSLSGIIKRYTINNYVKKG